MSFVSSFSSANWTNPDTNFGLGGGYGGYGGLGGRPMITPQFSTPVSTMSFTSGNGYGGYGGLYGGGLGLLGVGMPFTPFF